MDIKDVQLQRSIFRWVCAEDEARGRINDPSLALITVYEVATEYGVPVDALAKHLRREKHKTESCRTLPFRLLIAILYTVVVISHDPVMPITAVQDAVKHAIREDAEFSVSTNGVPHKNIEDVDSYDDFWEWLLDGLLPVIFVQERQVSQGLNVTGPEVAAFMNMSVAERGWLLNFNRMIYGLRFRQERSNWTSCLTKPPVHKHCVGGYGYEMYPGVYEGFSTLDPQGEFMLYSADDLSTITAIVGQKADEKWVDSFTRKVEIAIPMFNGEYNVHSLVTVNFYFSRGGHIWKRIIGMSTYANWYHSPWLYVADAFWVCTLFLLSIREVWEVHKVRKRFGWTSVKDQYLGFWNMIDWLCLAVGIGLIGMYIGRLNKSNELNCELQVLGELSEWNQTDEYRSQAAKYVKVLEEEVQSAFWFRMLSGVNPLLITLRLFKAFSAQPRLSQLTRTLLTASTDLFHFLLVFCSVFLTYAVAGVLVFGREVAGFTTLWRAIVSCLEAMMGEFHWDEMSQVSRGVAAIWFVSFMVIVVMLMLNMLLAIVMGAFFHQKETCQSEKTVWKEAWQILRGSFGSVEDVVDPDDVMEVLYNNVDEMKEVVTRPNVTDWKRDPFQNEAESWFAHKQVAANSEYTKGSLSQWLKPVLRRTSSLTRTLDRIAPFKDLLHGDPSTEAKSTVHRLVTVDILLELIPKLRDQALELIMKVVVEHWQAHQEETNIDEMVRAVTRVNHRVSKLLETAVKDELPEGQPAALIGSDGGPTFKDVLRACHEQLHAAKGRVEAGCTERMFPSAPGRVERKRTPLKSFQNVARGDVLQVLGCLDTIVEACRKAGVRMDTREQIRPFLNAFVRIIAVESRHLARCRLPGVGDFVFPASAFSSAALPEQLAVPTHKNPSTRGSWMYGGDEDQEFMDDSTALKRWTTSDSQVGSIAVTATDSEQSRHVEEAFCSPEWDWEDNIERPTLQDLPAEGVQELLHEAKHHRHNVEESHSAIHEMQARLATETEGLEHLSRVGDELDNRVVLLRQENKRLLTELQGQEKQLLALTSSRDEYLALVKTLRAEKEKLTRGEQVAQNAPRTPRRVV